MSALLQHLTDPTKIVIAVEAEPSPANDGAMVNNVLAFPTREPVEAGKAGEGGDIKITNAEFIAAVFHKMPEGGLVAACSISGDSSTSKNWGAKRADQIMNVMTSERNNYFNCSSFYLKEDGSFCGTLKQFAARHFLVLDDLGTKVSFARLGNFKLSWLIETSPGNFQGGIILTEPVTDCDLSGQLIKAIIAADLCDGGATGAIRWSRLPVAINGKAKYLDEDGNPFNCRLAEWNPETRYTPQEIIDGLVLVLASVKSPRTPITISSGTSHSLVSNDFVYSPKATENPVISELKARGFYKATLGADVHDITCPWVTEHTDELDSGAAYFEPSDEYRDNREGD